MPADQFYGAECEVRFGRMADGDTDPTTWFRLPFVSANFNPQREQRRRQLLNTARFNTLDPIQSHPGLFRLSADITVPADTRLFGRWMWLGYGNPTTAAVAGEEDPALFTHQWRSGAKTSQLFAAQFRTAANKVHVYRGLTIGSVSFDVTGEQVKDFDIVLGLRGISREIRATFIGAAPDNLIPDAPVLRTVLSVDDGESEPRTTTARWSWDRQMREDIFLSPEPTISGNSPQESVLQGSANFRAMGAPFDDVEEADTDFPIALVGIGSIEGHGIEFAHESVKFSAAPIAFSGPGEIERSWSWEGAQTAGAAAAAITVTNNLANYA